VGFEGGHSKTSLTVTNANTYASPKMSGTGGTLAISDGAQTVDLALLGHYSADNFSIVSDHAHGALVTYVPHDLAV
jgi:hypothetical protein